MVSVGWWPPEIEFDTRDLNTVIEIVNKGNK